MKFDIEHLNRLAERLDYKPDSQQHKYNLAEYCNSDRMMAIAKEFRVLEQSLESTERERDEAIAAHRKHAASLIADRGLLRERAEAAEAELTRRDVGAWDAVAWLVLNSRDGYIERNPEAVASLEAARLTKCIPLYTAAQPAALPPKITEGLAENGLCCVPSEDEKKLLADGDFTPEELWGVGGVKSCPKCIGKSKRNPTNSLSMEELVPVEPTKRIMLPEEIDAPYVVDGDKGAFEMGGGR